MKRQIRGDSMAEKVQIELHTTIDDNGQMEYNTIRTTGVYYAKPAYDVLTFKEKGEDGTVHNLLTIRPEKVSMKRTGLVEMTQQFRLQNITENVFTHPYGNIHMETSTHDISYQVDKNLTGKLQVNYAVKLNGQEERNQKMEISFTKLENE